MEIINLSIFVFNFLHSLLKKKNRRPIKMKIWRIFLSLSKAIIYTSWVLFSPWPTTIAFEFTRKIPEKYLFHNIASFAWVSELGNVCERERASVICINILDFIKCYERHQICPPVESSKNKTRFVLLNEMKSIFKNIWWWLLDGEIFSDAIKKIFVREQPENSFTQQSPIDAASSKWKSCGYYNLCLSISILISQLWPFPRS